MLSFAMRRAKPPPKKFDWLLAVTAAETLAPDIFVKMQPALRLHDAVWGGAALGPRDRTAAEARADHPARGAGSAAFFHAALRGGSARRISFARVLALEALRAADTSAWYADYMLNLWERGGAYKTAQCLTHFHTPLPQLARAGPRAPDRQPGGEAGLHAGSATTERR